MPNIKILRLANAYEKNGADVQSSLQRIGLVSALQGPLVLAPKARAVIPTGLAVELPLQWEAQIHPLPSMAREHGVTVLNSPGTIDPDYRGEVMVILINLGETEVTIERGMPIALMSFAPFTRVVLVPVDSLKETDRSDKGMGSTGR